MPNKILSVNGISKKYFIGKNNHHKLGDNLSGSVRSFFSNSKIPKENKEIWALDNVSFDLYEGDVLGIIGRNGAGKSTLLKIISEITSPTKGTVTYAGKLTSILEIGTGFHPDLTGRENTYLNAAFFGMTKKEVGKKMNDIVEYSGIEDFFDTPVKHYSSGMYLRLAFAIAFHADIEILIVDEILAVGDAAFRMKSFERIQQLAVAGKTIILATHNLGQISGLCNKCLLLEKGRVKGWGTAAEVMENYSEETINEFQDISDFGAPTQRKRSCGMLLVWDDMENVIGNDEFRLLLAEVKAVGKTVEDSIYVSDGIAINFQLEKLNNSGKMETGVRISNAEGLQVITDSFGFRIGNKTFLTDKKVYNISCKIPGNLLNFGLYSINFVVSYDENSYKEFPYLLRFKILPNPTESNFYWSQIKTLLKVPLEWKVD
jgi:lipopolysaccharide transport system ATP-binding protein